MKFAIFGDIHGNLEGLQAVIAEGDRLLAPREAMPTPAMHLAELDALRRKH